MDILIVDSSLLNSRTVALMYEAFGCRVVCAEDVEQAVEVVAQRALDVVIAGGALARDLGVPLCAAIRAVRPGLNIVVMCDEARRFPQHYPAFDAAIRSTCFYSDLIRFRRSTDK